MPRRRTNVLIAAAGLGIGGAEVVIRSLVQTLDRDRFNVSVCCLKVAGPIGEALQRDGADVEVLARRGPDKADYLTVARMFRLLKAKQIEVVHSHTTDALAEAAVCRLLLPRLRLVHTFHFGNYPHLHPRQRLLERMFARISDRLVAVSEVQREQLCATYGFRTSDVYIVRNGAPPSSALSTGSFRRKVGGSDRVLIGTVATLTRQKGLPDLLRVARRLKDSGRRVRFVILGDGPMRSELESLRLELDVEDAVSFLGWVHDAASTALPDFDIFFQPSLWEAMSIATLEAMAAGKPVVATRVGENPFIIDHGVSGVLVEPADVDGMADALGRLADDAELRRRLGEAGAARFAHHFTINHMTRNYEKIYRELAE